MSRKSLALVVSTALVLSSISGAYAQPAPAKPDQTIAASTSNAQANTASPLPPGGAAGIQEAQGLTGNDYLLIGLGVVLIGALIAVALSNNNSSSSTN